MEGIYLSPALPCAGFWWGSQFRPQSQLQAPRLADGSQFVASSWPVASLLLAHLPSPLQPSSGAFLNGRHTVMAIWRGETGVWLGTGFAVLKWDEVQNITLGSSTLSTLKVSTGLARSRPGEHLVSKKDSVGWNPACIPGDSLAVLWANPEDKVSELDRITKWDSCTLGSSSQSQIPGFCLLREPRGSSSSPSRPCSSLFCAVVSRLPLICPGEVCPVHRDSPWLTLHLACVPRMDDLKRILYSGLQHFLVPGLWVLNNLWKSSLCSV